VLYPFKKGPEHSKTAKGGERDEKEKEAESGGNKKRGSVLVPKQNKCRRKYGHNFMPRYVKKLIRNLILALRKGAGSDYRITFLQQNSLS